jgi:hypothetical protein
VLARENKIDAREFSGSSHVQSLLYGHAAHTLSLNDTCDALAVHEAGFMRVRGATPPARNAFKKRPCQGKILRDVLVRPAGVTTAKDYPDVLRLVTALINVEGVEREMTFVTNALPERRRRIPSPTRDSRSGAATSCSAVGPSSSIHCSMSSTSVRP